MVKFPPLGDQLIPILFSKIPQKTYRLIIIHYINSFNNVTDLENF